MQRTTVGAVLQRARDGSYPHGWMYLPDEPDWPTLDTECVVADDYEWDDPYLPDPAIPAGFDRLGLGDESLKRVTAWARLFLTQPSLELLLEGFLCYWRYDFFPEKPGAPLPTPADLQRRRDRVFYERLGAERQEELCRTPNCNRGRIEHSVMCRPHHFEMIWKRQCPFED